ncbi:MAG: hypothetical protein WC632_00725 [Candidatus Margulisiibacteriota bacterium]
MDPDIKKLIDLTTIVKVDDNILRKTIFGDAFYVSRFINNQGQQIILSDLAQNWENKWLSFGELWNGERQNYRFLFDSFKLYYLSFEQLRINKVSCINEAFGDRDKMVDFNQLTGLNMYGMYYHGKKCIDLLIKLKLINENHNDWAFCKKFSETRNKLIEHNFNPNGLSFQIAPSIWSLASTDSLLVTLVHSSSNERAFDVYVDYYDDYYQLERILVNVIRGF